VDDRGLQLRSRRKSDIISGTTGKDNISDFFTKALLCSNFPKFRALCMNESDMSEIEI